MPFSCPYGTPKGHISGRMKDMIELCRFYALKEHRKGNKTATSKLIPKTLHKYLFTTALLASLSRESSKAGNSVKEIPYLLSSALCKRRSQT